MTRGSNQTLKRVNLGILWSTYLEQAGLPKSESFPEKPQFSHLYNITIKTAPTPGVGERLNELILLRTASGALHWLILKL